MSAELEDHIGILHKVRRLAEKTTDSLKPENPAELDAQAIAQRRWQIHLGVLMIDVLRSMEKLARAKESRSCVILGRSVYEYQLRSEWCLKHPDKALALFETIPKRHYTDMQRLPPLDPQTEVAMASSYLEWRKSADLSDENMGVPGVVTMSLDLARPEDKLQDATGRQYVNAETIANAIPSWYVHGNPQLIYELFDDWTNPENWHFSKELRVMRLPSIIRGAIGSGCVYLANLRRAFGMDDSEVKNLYLATAKLAGLRPPS